MVRNNAASSLSHSSGSADAIPCCKILMPVVPAFRRIEHGEYADGSILPYLVTEALSHGASELLLTHKWRYGDAVKNLSPLIVNRVSFVTEGKYQAALNDILDPVTEEVGLERISGAYKHTNKYDEKLADPCLYLLEFSNLFAAMDVGAAVHLNYREIQKSLAVLQANLRSPESRASLATLKNVLSTYRPQRVGGLAFVSEDRGEVYRAVADVLADSAFLRLSAKMHDIGFPSRLIEAIKETRLFARRVVRHSAFAGVVNYSSNLVSTAVQLPTPDHTLIEGFMKHGFLPPIVNLSSVMNNAYKTWEKDEPPFVRPHP